MHIKSWNTDSPVQLANSIVIMRRKLYSPAFMLLITLFKTRYCNIKRTCKEKMALAFTCCKIWIHPRVFMSPANTSYRWKYSHLGSRRMWESLDRSVLVVYYELWTFPCVTISSIFASFEDTWRLQLFNNWYFQVLT